MSWHTIKQLSDLFSTAYFVRIMFLLKANNNVCIITNIKLKWILHIFLENLAPYFEGGIYNAKDYSTLMV